MYVATCGYKTAKFDTLVEAIGWLRSNARFRDTANDIRREISKCGSFLAGYNDGWIIDMSHPINVKSR